mgnify:CR=1 FL=1
MTETLNSSYTPKTTLWITVANAIAGALGTAIFARYPDVSYWCGVFVTVSSAGLVAYKQFLATK